MQDHFCTIVRRFLGFGFFYESCISNAQLMLNFISAVHIWYNSCDIMFYLPITYRTVLQRVWLVHGFGQFFFNLKTIKLKLNPIYFCILENNFITKNDHIKTKTQTIHKTTSNTIISARRVLKFFFHEL